MAVHDDAREDYADENLPVFLLLGLDSALRRLEPLLPPPSPSPQAPASPGPDAVPRSGRFLYLVLGLIAFRRQWLATLAPLLAVPPPAERHETSPGTQRSRDEAPRMPSPRELLR